MDLRTKAEIARENKDFIIRKEYDRLRAEGVARCRIVASMARDGGYGYTSTNSIYRSLKRTERHDSAASN